MAKHWDQKDVFKLVRGHFGWGPNSTSLYGDIERGKRPLTYDDKVVLAALYGKTPADVPEAPVVQTNPDLASALVALTEKLDAQAIAIMALADQVEGLLASQPKPVELAHALGEAVALAVHEAWRAAGSDDVAPRP